MLNVLELHFQGQIFISSGKFMWISQKRWQRGQTFLLRTQKVACGLAISICTSDLRPFWRSGSCKFWLKISQTVTDRTNIAIGKKIKSHVGFRVTRYFGLLVSSTFLYKVPSCIKYLLVSSTWQPLVDFQQLQFLQLFTRAGLKAIYVRMSTKKVMPPNFNEIVSIYLKVNGSNFMSFA